MTFQNLTSTESTERALRRTRVTIERRRKQRMPIVIGAVAGLALATTAGGIAVVQANLTQQNHLTRCFSAWSTSSEYYDSANITDPNQSTKLNPTEQRVAAALEACEAGWRSGLWPTTTPPGPLKACRLNDSRIAILPQERTGEGCKDLGLTEP